MAGKSIRRINRCLSDAITVGVIDREGRAVIGDPNTVTLEEGYQLILLQEDDDTVIPEKEQEAVYTPSAVRYQAESSSILIIGCNEKFPYILHEMCEYLSA